MASPAEAADPDISDCSVTTGEAPAGFANQDCDDVCTWSSGTETVTCDLSSCAGGEVGNMVHDFSGTGSYDFSAWGSCSGASWCCLIKDDSSSQKIDTVILKGSEGGDTLSFKESATVELEPHKGASAALEAIMQGLGDVDDMVGSDCSDSYYVEKLAGGDGGDTIAAGDGKNIVRWQDGDDTVQGGSQADRMNGGYGVDSLEGLDGWDTYCDNSGPTASTCESNYFDEATFAGNDKFWLDDSNCTTAGGNLAFADAGSGTDSCGPATWSPLTNWTSCEILLTSEPAQCP